MMANVTGIVMAENVMANSTVDWPRRRDGGADLRSAASRFVSTSFLSCIRVMYGLEDGR